MNGNVVALKPATTTAAPPSRLHEALDALESAARDSHVFFVDVAVQLALARELVDIVQSIHLGSEPTIAQVNSLRELRLALTDLRQLVDDHARNRRR